MNSVALTGRITKDAELRTTTNGKSMTSFSIAVQDSRKDEKGDYITYFLDCVAWSKTAEAIVRNIHKGDMMGVEGKLTARNWTDREGNNRKAVEVLVQNITFLQPKQKGEASTFVPEESDRTIIDNDEDLPF